jgi:hypothetical protein
VQPLDCPKRDKNVTEFIQNGKKSGEIDCLLSGHNPFLNCFNWDMGCLQFQEVKTGL